MSSDGHGKGSDTTAVAVVSSGGGTDRVWKFLLPAPGSTGRSWVDLPATARPISVGLQDGAMVVWTLCDPDQEVEFGMQVTGAHRFIVANTGQEIPRFLGTLTADTGDCEAVASKEEPSPSERLGAHLPKAVR